VLSSVVVFLLAAPAFAEHSVLARFPFAVGLRVGIGVEILAWLEAHDSAAVREPAERHVAAFALQ
jgi:hypothetical protein